MSSKGIALVTGAAQGLGKAIALRLADDGFDVAVNDIPSNATNLSQVRNDIQAKGRASSVHIADVSVEDQVKKMFKELVATHGGLDVMVANAGVALWRSIVDTTVEEWDRVMTINGRGTFLCYKYAGMQMVSQGRGGRIIGASSLAGKTGVSHLGAYCASKFAVRGLTQAAALEFGRHNITVNAYAPGAIDSEMPKERGAARTPGVCSDHSNRRTGFNIHSCSTATDISNLVSFLASKESQFITGMLCLHSRTKDIPLKSRAGQSSFTLTSPSEHYSYRPNSHCDLMSSKGIALVTGAAQGLGKAIALRVADDGFDVAVNDILSNAVKISQVMNDIQAKGRASSVHIADVSVEDQVKKMIEEVVATHGGLDVMVANAGVALWRSIVDTTVEEWDRVMTINGRGTFLCYKYAGMQMASQGRGGRIIGASSLAGKTGVSHLGAYCASKFAVRGLTQAAALEFGRHNITVNAYAPGTIDSEMHRVAARAPGVCSDYSNRRTGFNIHSCSTATDISNLVSFLASKESQFITGRLCLRSRTNNISLKSGVGQSVRNPPFFIPYSSK
ncbi:NAD(P)-binding protein [Mycena galericulata]|nr:NAD(P)-binding protein [Mycena galericulata]